jgi:hypothetical protein
MIPSVENPRLNQACETGPSGTGAPRTDHQKPSVDVWRQRKEIVFVRSRNRGAATAAGRRHQPTPSAARRGGMSENPFTDIRLFTFDPVYLNRFLVLCSDLNSRSRFTRCQCDSEATTIADSAYFNERRSDDGHSICAGG